MLADEGNVVRHRVDEMRFQSIQRRAEPGRFIRDHFVANLALDRRQHRAVRTDDARLLAGNLANVGTEESLVVKVHRRDHA